MVLVADTTIDTAEIDETSCRPDMTRSENLVGVASGERKYFITI